MWDGQAPSRRSSAPCDKNCSTSLALARNNAPDIVLGHSAKALDGGFALDVAPTRPYCPRWTRPVRVIAHAITLTVQVFGQFVSQDLALGAVENDFSAKNRWYAFWRFSCGGGGQGVFVGCSRWARLDKRGQNKRCPRAISPVKIRSIGVRASYLCHRNAYLALRFAISLST